MKPKPKQKLKKLDAPRAWAGEREGRLFHWAEPIRSEVKYLAYQAQRIVPVRILREKDFKRLCKAAKLCR